MPTVNIQKIQAAAKEKELLNTPTEEQTNNVIVGEALKEEDKTKRDLKKSATAEPPGSFKRKQINALSDFFNQPVSVGAIAGQVLAGIFGGSQAGAAATPIAMEFNKLASQNYNAAKDREVKMAAIDQEKELANSNQKNLQKSSDIIDVRNEESLSYDKRLGQYVNQSGVVVPAQFQRNLAVDQENRLKQFGATRIDQKYTDQALAGAKFQDKVGEDTEKKKMAVVKMVESNPVYKKTEEALNEVETIRSLLKDAYEKGGQSLAMLGPKIAKGIAGEVGVLTEADVSRYVKNPAAIGGLLDTLSKMKSGKITGQSKENIERLLDIMTKESLRKQENVINNISSRAAKTTKDFSKEEAKGFFKKEPEAVTKGSSIPLSQLSKEDRLKRIQELKAKAGK